SRACDIWGVTSLVKVNANEPGLIGRALDLGVQGVVVPHVNTKEEAERAVRAAKYAPVGMRAMGRPRQGYGVPDYFSKANDETILVVVIEDIEAVNNLKNILTVDHIDVFLVAPHDLSQTMGAKYLSGTWGQFHPDVMRVYGQAVKQIVAAGRVAGVGDTGDSSIEQKMEWGALYISTSRRPYAAAGGQQFHDKVAALAKGRQKQQAPTST
ncbi:MAG: aldolase/citrate lyase family protein, partial [Chloroflexota bacterium]